MNLALSDEQEFLREAARGALSRHKTVEAARDALEDPSALPDLWPTAVEAGWPGLLISEQNGGAGLDVFDALLVAEECGRVLASVPLLGLVPATGILEAAGDESLQAVAAGEVRPVYLPARPPSDLEPGWTVDPESGMGRASAPTATVDGDQMSFDGAVAFVPDAPGADLLVVVGQTDDGSPVAGVVEASAGGVSIEPVTRYDATRSLGNVTLSGAQGRRLDVGEDALSGAWYVAQSLLAAESLGAVDTCLEMSVEYAKERFTFGRAIGSYQAIKHELTEVLRQRENARSLQYYAGWARTSKPDEFPLAASAARAAAGKALDFAARSMINVHGGIGATWEHDAPLFFRRAQLSRRLLAGTHDATDRVAEQAMAGAAA
ncbi:MAG TPA: acyl-CoA dehydrogenase family protein [Solirubrobacteraceae bacterium]|nr:acyl-CoA dehydrogenase family protein [Solirubrobacteraceae bacterium]